MIWLIYWLTARGNTKVLLTVHWSGAKRLMGANEVSYQNIRTDQIFLFGEINQVPNFLGIYRYTCLLIQSLDQDWMVVPFDHLNIPEVPNENENVRWHKGFSRNPFFRTPTGSAIESKLILQEDPWCERALNSKISVLKVMKMFHVFDDISAN